MLRRSVAFLFGMSAFGLPISPVFAEFNTQNQRSINGTAETLQTGTGEMGLASLSLGITDNLMMTVPTLPMFLGNFGAALRYKFETNRNFRISPEAGVAYADGLLGPSGGLMVGVDTQNRKHSFSFGATYLRARGLTGGLGDLTLTDEATWHPSMKGNYDYYTDNGNLFFAGFVDLIPYVGFTWAWEHFHVGIAAVTIFPFPYLYWRF